MKTLKITEGEIGPLKVASLPSRPTAPTSFGGKGYTATQMKEAFDRLPLLIIGRLNSLIGDLQDPDDGVSGVIPTGIREGHTLSDLFRDIESGDLCNYLSVRDGTLTEFLGALREELDRVKLLMGDAYTDEVTYTLDGGAPDGLPTEEGGEENG